MDPEGIRRDLSAGGTHGYFFSPLGRKTIAHGASRGNKAYVEEPPEGAKDGAPIFRPVPGLSKATVLPRLAPWARFFRSYGALTRNVRDIHFCIAHTHIRRSDALHERLGERPG